MIRAPPSLPLFPYNPFSDPHAEPVLEHALPLDQPQLALARLELQLHVADEHRARAVEHARLRAEDALHRGDEVRRRIQRVFGDRKSTRLNSSHSQISYAVFC